MEVSCPAALSIYVPHGSINLLTGAVTHATAARDQVFAERLQLLPNAPQHRGLHRMRLVKSSRFIWVAIFRHLITLFARSSTRPGIVRPICFAALRLMTNSNF